jgi:hypothetical protein
MADGSILDTTQTETKPDVKTEVKTEVKTDAKTDIKTEAKADDWRSRMAGGDEKELKRLERFASEADVFKSYRAIEQRISSGELKANKPFPDKGTLEEQNAWRKEQGIPEAPDKYEIKLEGREIGPDDKPLIESFLKEVHAVNMPPAQAKAAVAAYYKLQDEAVKKAQEAEAEKIKATEDALRVEWGNDYRRNLSVIDGLLDASVSSDSEMKALIKNATKGNAEFAKLLARWALEINPSATVVPNAGSNLASSIDDELAQIAEARKKDTRAYFKNETMLKRERELLEAKARVKK